MAIDVSPNSQANRDESPTNPKFADSSISDGDLMAVIIQTHPSGNPIFTIGSELSNKANTKGFRIKHDIDGSNLLTLSSFGTVDYFVLLYSDDPAKHHFAKITNLVVEDNGNGTTTGDAFEFEPRMGNEIPKGTKYRVITGVDNNVHRNSIVALSIGLKQETTYNLKNNIVCARPHFYFYNNRELGTYANPPIIGESSHGKIDKENELNHNYKYMATINSRTGNGTIEMGENIPNVQVTGTTGIVFRTQQDFGKRIIDYSKFGLKVTMTDVLRNIDQDGFHTTASGSTLLNYTYNLGQSDTITTDYTDYAKAYPSAKRILSNFLGFSQANPNLFNDGEIRYLHYDTSPKSANLITGVSQHETEDSIEQGSFSETRIIDNARIMRKKIEEHTLYQTKQLVHIGNLNDFVDLKATYSSTSSTNVFVFDTEYNLQTVLGVGDEIRLGTTIMLVETVSGSLITVRAEKREAGKNTFTPVTFTPTVGDTLQRRALDYTNQRIFTTMDLSGGVDRLEIVFTSGNLKNLFGEVTAKNIDQSTLTFNGLLDDSEFKSYYGVEAVKFAKGEYRVFSTRFTGEVEEINQVKEAGQTYLDIKGRGAFNKLLSPIVNKDAVFSEDIIYSTNSPTNTLVSVNLGTRTGINDAVGASLRTKISNSATAPVSVGDKLFTQRAFIGKVSSLGIWNGGSLFHLINFETGLLSTVLESDTIYVENEKNYMFSKALGSSNFASSSPTSLTGSADKGLIFTAGTTIDSTGAEVSALPNTSSNSHEKAIGYEINSPKNIKSDSSFECLLKDEIGGGTKSTFDTVNTLIDFEIVSTSKKDNVTQIELAPYIPITLGRQIEYEGKKQDRIEQTMLLACTVTTGQSTRVPLIVSTNQATDFTKVKVGEPLFLSRSGSSFDESFIGYVLDIEILEQKQDHITTGNPASNTTTAKILVDRTHTSSNLEIDLDVGDEIYVSQRAGNHLNLINSGHLWGGKMVSIPHQKTYTSGLVPFNAYRSATTDFTSIFGSPYYKIINADLFRIGNEKFTYKQNFSGFGFDYSGRYAGRKSEANVNFTAYKFKPRITSTDLTVVKSAQEGSNEELAYDTRGNKGIYGSRLTSSRRFDRANRLSQISHDFRFTSFDQVQHHEFQNDDESFNRLFMYVVSDLLPYSSLRTDSLFHVDGNGAATKSLGEYKLFLLENKKKTDDTNNLNIQDENYQSLSFTTDRDITQLKQLGLMRLTECVYDEYFNLINPEKSTEEIYFNNPLHFGGNIFTRTVSDEGGTALFVKEINATTIKFCNSGGTLNSVSLITGDEIFIGDKYVCTINGTSTGNTHNILTSRGSFTPNMDNTTVRAAFRLTDTRSIGIGGRKKTNSIFGTSPNSSSADGGYHPLKGAIIPKTSNYNYGEASGDTARVDNSGTVFSLLTDSEVVLPSIFTGNGFLTHTNFDNQEGATSHVIAKMSRNTVGISYANRNPHGGTIGVILDTYNIESDTNLLKVGDNTDVLGSQGDQRGGLSLDPTGIEPAREIVTVTSVNHYKQLLSPTQSSSSHNYSTDADRKSPADGAYLGFKLRLFSTSWTNTPIPSSNGTLYFNNISLNGANTILNSWLELVDLTGCYLVPEADSGTQTANAVGGVNLGQGRHADPIYVYSHEPQTLESSVNIITSASLDDNRAYRIMQPNQVCLYDFHPNEIHLNTLRPEYTKKANSNEVYKVTDNNYFFYEGNKPQFSSNEAVLSMFVAIDLDNKSGGGNIVVPKANTNTLLPSDTYSMFLSDGDTSLKSSVSSTITVDGKHAISFSNIKKLKGIVSISETFVVDSLEELKITPNRACIGSTVTIANETESLINEIFEEEGIKFTNSTPTYPLFIAPEFRGVSAFTAINFLLKRKDLRLLETEGVFSVVPHSDSSLVTNILIDDDKLIEFESTKTTFDFYNEVIVYGAAHKEQKEI